MSKTTKRNIRCAVFFESTRGPPKPQLTWDRHTADMSAQPRTARKTWRTLFFGISGGGSEISLWSSTCSIQPVGNGSSAATDTLMVVRCSYCVGNSEFVPMLAYKDGRFVCVWCAHTVRPGDPEYHCICRRCLETARSPLSLVPSKILTGEA
jgi:hypothetical protein